MLRHVSILVVEDDESQMRTFAIMLSCMGVQFVTQAGGVDEAWSALKYIAYDLVISDFGMTPLNGLQFLSMMRQQSKLAHIPFIMMTADASEDLWKKAIASGATEFLFKPFSYRDFQIAVRRALDLDKTDPESIVRLDRKRTSPSPI